MDLRSTATLTIVSISVHEYGKAFRYLRLLSFLSTTAPHLGSKNVSHLHRMKKLALGTAQEEKWALLSLTSTLGRWARGRKGHSMFIKI